MDFSRIPNRTLLGKVLRVPLRLLPGRMILPIMQGRLKGKRWIVGSGVHGFWLGSYEHDKQLLFEETVAPGSVVFDVGGHVGFYTLLASEIVRPCGKVFVFEPLARNLDYLHRHLRLNHVTNATVIAAAVSDRSERARFAEGRSSSMGHLSSDGELEVATVALDDLYASNEIPLPQYMKIDIEGAEARALKGAEGILRESHPTLFLATHGTDVHQECCDFLQALCYELKAIDGMPLAQSSEILAFNPRG